MATAVVPAASSARPARVLEQRLVLADADRVPGTPATIHVDLNKYDFKKQRKDDVIPLPPQIVKLVNDPAERRLMALGSFYKYLQIPEDEVKNVEAELRKAKHFEMLTLARSSRRAELVLLRDLVQQSDADRRETGQKIIIESQLLRPKALKVLSREMDHIRIEEQARLDEDRKKVLTRERNVLLDRRRVFEHSNAASAAAASGTGAGGGSSAPVLVMNVALGNGKEEKIVVRRHDDPSSVAMQFVKRHGLPDHTVAALANQIRTNVTHHVQVTSGRAATPTKRVTSRSPAASRR